jgi:hypothetical protein
MNRVGILPAMTSRLVRAGAGALALAFGAACNANSNNTEDHTANRADPRGETASAILHSVVSTELATSDSAYVAAPSYIAIDSADGSLYVSDSFQGHVLTFGRDGRYRGSVGRRGEEPSDLYSTGLVFPTRAEVLIVDNRHATIKRYDKRSGRYLGGTPTEGPITSAVGIGERVYFGGANTRRHTGLIVWQPSSNSLGRDSAGYPAREALQN